MKVYKPYVLTMGKRRGLPSYWTGKANWSNMKGVLSDKIDDAKRFRTAREAYDTGGLHPKLLYFRAIRTDHESYILRDGFIPRWWDPNHTFNEFETFGTHVVTSSPSDEESIIFHAPHVEGL